MLSALAHWAAIFGETDYLPLLAFPFVKLFQNNPLICFEVVATVIGKWRPQCGTGWCTDGPICSNLIIHPVGSFTVNWCQHWFEYFPNPPLNVLNLAENVLAHHDKELLQHFVTCGVTSQVKDLCIDSCRAIYLQTNIVQSLTHVFCLQMYAWPLLETLFSEVLMREEWLKLFDNVFSNHPSFLLMAVVAYVTCCRTPLLLCTDKKDFEVLLVDMLFVCVLQVFL